MLQGRRQVSQAGTDKTTPSSFSRLYRGITAPILMEAPKRATKFAANDEWGKFYRKAFGAEKMTQPLSVLTGATAGATESFVVVPFELVKIRLQDKANASKYNGMLDVVAKTVKQEGVLAMYQGLESTLWRHILWNAGYFGCIFQVRQLLPKAKDKSGQMVNDIMAGTVGGTVGTILNTPLDVVKSRIQNAVKVPGVTPKYNWAFPAVGTVLKEEGFAALYKGFLPKVLRLGPVSRLLLNTLTRALPEIQVLVADGEKNRAVVSFSWSSRASRTSSGSSKKTKYGYRRVASTTILGTVYWAFSVWFVCQVRVRETRQIPSTRYHSQVKHFVTL